jgi:uncharacterized protein
MEWIYLASALICAGFVQGLSGFGFGLVSMALMPLFMGVKEAAVISTVYTLMSTVTIFARHFRQYDWRQGLDFILSVCVGVPLGVFLLERGSEPLLVRLLGGLMVLYALKEFLLPKVSGQFPKVWTVPLGLFSGAMSGAFNLGGVPTAAYAYSNPWTRGQIMAFLQVMIMFSCGLRMIFYQQAGLLTGISWAHVLVMIAPLYVSIWLGHLVLQRTHPRHIRQGIFVFISLVGVYYLFFR